MAKVFKFCSDSGLMVTIDEKVLRKLNPADRLERIAQLRKELESEKVRLSRLEEQSQADLRNRIAEQTDLPSTEPIDISKLFESEEPKENKPQPVFEQVIGQMYRVGAQYEGGSVAAPETSAQPVEITERNYNDFVDPLQTKKKR